MVYDPECQPPLPGRGPSSEASRALAIRPAAKRKSPPSLSPTPRKHNQLLRARPRSHHETPGPRAGPSPYRSPAETFREFILKWTSDSRGTECRRPPQRGPREPYPRAGSGVVYVRPGPWGTAEVADTVTAGRPQETPRILQEPLLQHLVPTGGVSSLRRRRRRPGRTDASGSGRGGCERRCFSVGACSWALQGGRARRNGR